MRCLAPLLLSLLLTLQAHSWPSSFKIYPYNPVIVPAYTNTMQGSDNIYAPQINIAPGTTLYVMWFGGQGGDGHDRIFVRTSTDGMVWQGVPQDLAPQPALDNGNSNHVNDPSVVNVNSVWKMYYTDAGVDTDDRIWLATSSSIMHFTKVGQVLGPVAGTWESDKVGRPSVLYYDGVYHMWYDGSNSTLRSVGYANSTDGINFSRYSGNPVFLNGGAVDVKRIGSAATGYTYVMVREGSDGTYWATSPDGLKWQDNGKLFGLSGQAYDLYGQVTPFIQLTPDETDVIAIWFGGASVSTWNRNRIAVAFSNEVTPFPGGGCTACTPPGMDCAQDCVSDKYSSYGVCAAPGSTDPGKCCNCISDGCDSCNSALGCEAACQGIGLTAGYCGYPGSTNSSRCCICVA